jgi:predicted transcriptional regulator
MPRVPQTNGVYETREEMEQAIKDFREEGRTTTDIAELVGVSQGTVCRLLRGWGTKPKDGNHFTPEDSVLRAKLNQLWPAT